MHFKLRNSFLNIFFKISGKTNVRSFKETHLFLDLFYKQQILKFISPKKAIKNPIQLYNPTTLSRSFCWQIHYAPKEQKGEGGQKLMWYAAPPTLLVALNLFPCADLLLLWQPAKSTPIYLAKVSQRVDIKTLFFI